MISYSIDLFLLSMMILLMEIHQTTLTTSCGDTIDLIMFLSILLGICNVVFSFKYDIIKKNRTIARAMYFSAMFLPAVSQLLINGAIALTRIPTKSILGISIDYVKIEYNDSWIIASTIVLIIILVVYGTIYYQSEYNGSDEEDEEY